MFGKKTPPQPPSTSPTASRPEWLAAPPLVPGEDEEKYHSLYSAVTETIEPKNAIEGIFVAEFCDFSWEIHRLRRIRDQIITSNMREGLVNMLQPLTGDATAQEVSNQWQVGNDEGVKKVEKFLQDSKFTTDTVVAAAFDVKIGVLNVIEDMIKTKVAARAFLLQDIDRRRGLAAQRAVREFESSDERSLSVPKAIDVRSHDQPPQN